MSKIFGKSFSEVGKTDADLLLKTRANVKILTGRKFIDLIKDGKIAVNDVEFIFEANEVGDDDGIYVIGSGDDLLVILKVGDLTVTLLGEIGTTYVSFMGELETTGEMKYTALTNIGFIYSTLADAQLSTSLQNGIVYVEQTLKLYTVVDGVLTEYTFEFPNPFTEQFIIAKTTDEEGALVIQGEGIENALMFDTLTIYVEDNKTYIDSEGDIKIYRNGNLKLTIKGDLAIFTTDVVSDMFMSESATSTNGFRLYMQNGESTLEVDNLVVRNGIEVASTLHYFPVWWYYYNNRVTTASFFDASSSNYGEDDSEEYDGEEYSSLGLLLTLNYESTFVVGDSGYIYYLDNGSVIEDSEADSEDDIEYIKVWTTIPFTVINTSDSSIYAEVTDSSYLSYDYEDLCEGITGMPIFKIINSTLETTSLLRIDENINFIEATELDDASINTGDLIVVRVGNLTELGKNLHITDSDGNESEEALEGNGIYSKNFITYKAQYDSTYELEEDDNTSRFASTEWVNTKTKGFGIITDEESEIKAEKPNDTLILKAGDYAFLDYDISSKSITIDTYEIKAGNNVIIELDNESKSITIHSLGGNSSDSEDSEDSELSGYITAINYKLESIFTLIEELQNRVYYVVTLVLTNLSSSTGTVYVVKGGDSTSFTLKADSGYNLPSSISMTSNGSTYSDYSYSSSTGAITISNINNNIIVTAVGTVEEEEEEIYTGFALRALDTTDSTNIVNTYYLYNSSNTLIHTFETLSSGYSESITGLTEGTYTLKEASTPSGYEAFSDLTLTVTKDDDGNYDITFDDSRYSDCGWVILNTSEAIKGGIVLLYTRDYTINTSCSITVDATQVDTTNLYNFTISLQLYDSSTSSYISNLSGLSATVAAGSSDEIELNQLSLEDVECSGLRLYISTSSSGTADVTITVLAECLVVLWDGTAENLSISRIGKISASGFSCSIVLIDPDTYADSNYITNITFTDFTITFI